MEKQPWYWRLRALIFLCVVDPQSATKRHKAKERTESPDLRYKITKKKHVEKHAFLNMAELQMRCELH